MGGGDHLSRDGARARARVRDGQHRHAEHRTGVDADVRSASLGGYVTTFLTLARKYGGDGGGPIINEGNHLRFAY